MKYPGSAVNSTTFLPKPKTLTMSNNPRKQKSLWLFGAHANAECQRHLANAEAHIHQIRALEHELDIAFFQQSIRVNAPSPPLFFSSTTAPTPDAPRPGTEPPTPPTTASHREDITPETLGNRLRTCREQAGMTQQELANTTGIRRPNIARLERGANFPNIATLQRIAVALSISLAELLDDNERPHS